MVGLKRVSFIILGYMDSHPPSQDKRKQFFYSSSLSLHQENLAQVKVHAKMSTKVHAPRLKKVQVNNALACKPQAKFWLKSNKLPVLNKAQVEDRSIKLGINKALSSKDKISTLLSLSMGGRHKIKNLSYKHQKISSEHKHNLNNAHKSKYKYKLKDHHSYDDHGAHSNLKDKFIKDNLPNYALNYGEDKIAHFGEDKSQAELLNQAKAEISAKHNHEHNYEHLPIKKRKPILASFFNPMVIKNTSKNKTLAWSKFKANNLQAHEAYSKEEYKSKLKTNTITSLNESTLKSKSQLKTQLKENVQAYNADDKELASVSLAQKFKDQPRLNGKTNNMASNSNSSNSSNSTHSKSKTLSIECEAKRNTIMSIERMYEHLNKVSRSFALTIPLMGMPLKDYISLAYLLCRMVDTIEDDACALRVDKITWLSDFAFLSGEEFEDEHVLLKLKARALELTSKGSSQDDVALLHELDEAVNLLKSFDDKVKTIICHGVAILSHGMASSLRRENELGSEAIANLDDVDNYCYFVAGVVGEMLAELFCLQDKKADKRKLMELAVSFGEGLQLTNILRDRNKDAQRGVSFLPQCEDDLKSKLILDYVALNQGHLDDAIEFICTLSPKYSRGVRLFCFTNVAMAILINRKIARAPLDPKSNYGISRKSVKYLFMLAKLMAHSNFALKVISLILSLGMKRLRRNPRKLRDKVSLWDHSSSTN